MSKSIWVASATNIEHYRKYDADFIVNDVTNEFKSYSTFNGLHKGIVVGRIMNAIKQSLRVRGVNVLFRMRRNLINYEKQITKEICLLEKEILGDKVAMQMSHVDPYEHSDYDEYLHHSRCREQYLKTKIRLQSKILERQNIRKLLNTSAEDILKEHS